GPWQTKPASFAVAPSSTGAPESADGRGAEPPSSCDGAGPSAADASRTGGGGTLPPSFDGEGSFDDAGGAPEAARDPPARAAGSAPRSELQAIATAVARAMANRSKGNRHIGHFNKATPAVYLKVSTHGEETTV